MVSSVLVVSSVTVVGCGGGEMGGWRGGGRVEWREGGGWNGDRVMEFFLWESAK